MACGLWANKGKTLVQLKRYDEAIACFDKALSHMPDDSSVKQQREEALKKRGNGKKSGQK